MIVKGKIVVMSVVMSVLLVGCGLTEDSSTSTDATDGAEQTDDEQSDVSGEKEAESKQTESENDESTSEAVNGELTAHYFDVGQADSTLLKYRTEHESYRVLIDAGDWDADDVSYYLNDLNVEALDLVIGTHAHADHIGQLDRIINQFDVEEVWLTGNEGTSETFAGLVDTINEADVAYEEPRAGEAYDIGPLEIDVLHPRELTDDYNQDSISTKMTFGETSFVFTGDAEESSEASMVSGGVELAGDVLQLGHHGSHTSTTAQFLQAVNPEVAIYSAGAQNSYGHPHHEVIERVRAADVDLYGTDVHGTVTVTTDGESISVETQHDGEVERGASDGTQTNQDREEQTTTGDCVNINDASSEQLQAITHIGPDRAAALIELRPFDSVSQLTRINGIGDGRISDIQAEGLACVGGES
ncbi:beta-lactamase superfamily II metal-dependent hydrolase [Alkalibacillus flavidus]|uniref:Beta-lactamase superfamily II metal-dependent hydrolase n=1 Tax=Alkalibacillus flavidus TaxID=546021 RepID=A0ABV2KZJ2_9BACI